MPILLLIAVILIGAALVVFVSDRRFNTMVSKETQTLMQDAKSTYPLHDPSDLPEPVQKYLKRNLKTDRRDISRVWLKQTGTMRLTPDQPWKPFKAEQHFSIAPMAFVWTVRMAFLPLVWVAGRDKYMGQDGHMLIKILSLLPVVNAKGPKITTASLMRYLAEMPWFPVAMLNKDNIRWEAIDATSAKAIVRDGDVEAAVTFYFNEAGDIVKLLAYRYKDTEDTEPTPWHGRYADYQKFDGFRIPTVCEVGWEPESGYYTWWRGTIEDLRYV